MTTTRAISLALLAGPVALMAYELAIRPAIRHAWTRLQLWAGEAIEGHVTAALGEDTSVTAEAERITRTAVS